MLWLQLFDAGKTRDVLHGMHSPIVAVWLTFRSFWQCLIVFVQMICLNDVFLLKAMTGVALNIFLNVFLIFGHVYIYQTQLCISRNFKKFFVNNFCGSELYTLKFLTQKETMVT